MYNVQDYTPNKCATSYCRQHSCKSMQLELVLISLVVVCTGTVTVLYQNHPLLCVYSMYLVSRTGQCGYQFAQHLQYSDISMQEC